MDKMITTDAEAWQAYPELRMFFNKLEIALAQGIEAIPAGGLGGDPDETYIVRPTYNLDGMGLNARKVRFDDPAGPPKINPGEFLQPYIEGNVISTDYHKLGGGWVKTLEATGFRGHFVNCANLRPGGEPQRFFCWYFENMNMATGIADGHEPIFQAFGPLLDKVPDHTNMCVESIDGVVIDVHFRPNPDHKHREVQCRIPINSDLRKANEEILSNLVKQVWRTVFGTMDDQWQKYDWTIREDQDAWRWGFIEGRLKPGLV